MEYRKFHGYLKRPIACAYKYKTIMGGVIGVRFGTPFWNEDGKIISWVLFFNNPDSSRVSSPTLLSLGVSAQVDLTSRDWQDWKVTAWYSRGEFYNSTEQFLSAISSPDFEKPLPNVDGDWAATDQKGAPLPLDILPPPVTVSQGSNRFKLDVQEDYVSWMDFTFYHSMAWDVGLSLFDINYKGKRLMYELSLQEALTHYAGSEPFASQTAFFDVNNGFGTTIQPLIRGYDCPAHATYLNTTFSEGNSTRTVPGAVCMFEYDSGYPIRRHSFSPGAPHTSVAKNIVFTVRTISTVGNYDFMIDYNFFYDGAVEVSARASGYISATYWDGNSEYGFHIHDQLSGSLHDHTLTFKADLDILGTQNSVQKVEFVPTSTTYPWSQGRIHNTFKAERSFVDTETSINWAGNDAALYAIVNKDTPNRFGEYPGYRIKRSSGTTHLTVQNSTNIVKTGAYTTHDFYITKQKDVEPRLADPYNQFSLDDPLVDFAQFLDEESIEQQDLYVFLLLSFFTSLFAYSM
jgi:primary-amine oxidase